MVLQTVDRTVNLKQFLQACYDSGWNRLGKPSITSDCLLKLLSMLPSTVNVIGLIESKNASSHDYDELLDFVVSVLSLMNYESLDDLVLIVDDKNEILNYLVEKTKKPSKVQFIQTIGNVGLDKCYCLIYETMIEVVSAYFSSNKLDKPYFNLIGLCNIVEFIILACDYVGFDLIEEITTIIIVSEPKIDKEKPKELVLGTRYHLPDTYVAYKNTFSYYELVSIQNGIAILWKVLKTKLSPSKKVSYRILDLLELDDIRRGTEEWNKHFTVDGQLLLK